VFGRTATQPFSPMALAERADKAWAAAELERVTLHNCRHSYSTYLDTIEISETRADRYMGHSNPSVQARYRHQLEGQLAEDAKRLDDYVAGAVEGKVVAIADAR
jgi:integrase